MVTDLWSLMITAMPMMLFMIWTARTCKEDACALSSRATRVTDAADVLEVAAAVAIEAVEATVMEAADPVETHPDPGLTTDLLWRTCPLVHLGRT